MDISLQEELENEKDTGRDPEFYYISHSHETTVLDIPEIRTKKIYQTSMYGRIIDFNDNEVVIQFTDKNEITFCVRIPLENIGLQPEANMEVRFDVTEEFDLSNFPGRRIASHEFIPIRRYLPKKPIIDKYKQEYWRQIEDLPVEI